MAVQKPWEDPAAEEVAPLGVRIVPDAVVYPTLRVDSRPGQLLMGVYDNSGSYVEETVLNRRSGERGHPVPPELFPDVREGEPEAIYGGPLYYHFGHFLLESLARAWYAAQHPELPLVWAASHAWEGRELRGWQREILDILGLANPVVISATPRRIGRLHIPDIGYRYDDWCHPHHAAFLASYSGPEQVSGERLWLSRSKLDSEVRDLSAEAVERRLTAAGWTVSHPETLPVHDQLDQMSRAELVSGEEGSAFHALLLLRDLEGKRFQVLRRRGPEHRNMITVGDAREVDQSFVTLRRERIVKADGTRKITKLNPSSAEVLDLFDIPPVEPHSGLGQDLDGPFVDEVLRARSPKRALQVGARRPLPSLLEGGELRAVVSAELDVDPRTLSASGAEIYELSIAHYIEGFHESRAPFDLIRLADPDFEQRIADFEAGQELAHDQTVWLLGTGPVAARTALALRALNADFAVRQMRVGRRGGYLMFRDHQAATEPRDFAELSDAAVRRRARLLPIMLPASLDEPALTTGTRAALVQGVLEPARRRWGSVPGRLRARGRTRT